MVFTHAEEPAPEDKFILGDNPWTIARFGDVMVLGNIRHFTGTINWDEFEGDMTWLSNIYEVIESDD